MREQAAAVRLRKKWRNAKTPAGTRTILSNHLAAQSSMQTTPLPSIPALREGVEDANSAHTLRYRRACSRNDRGDPALLSLAMRRSLSGMKGSPSRSFELPAQLNFAPDRSLSPQRERTDLAVYSRLCSQHPRV